VFALLNPSRQTSGESGRRHVGRRGREGDQQAPSHLSHKEDEAQEEEEETSRETTLPAP
jgi:hypothetical protein